MSANTRKGAALWDEYQRKAKREYLHTSFEERMAARERAAQTVSRLAPELTLSLMDSLHTGKVMACASGLVVAGANFCCLFTFEDEWVPEVERALTNYLYYKLFPKRFFRRPLHHYRSPYQWLRRKLSRLRQLCMLR